jgi:hypothetical protein
MTTNDVVIEAWNTVLHDKFVRFKHLLVAGLAGHSDRMAGAEGERLTPTVVAALRQTLARYVRGDGVWAPSSTWFITARRPR